ncbi:MAG TPA: phosphate ABC transporter permease PstA [Candidatus Sulfotelmatobacter sp.]|nr:phosphate ABC transporter permease PstA [Candidatus Sulfotelmatobacter sp.]
MNRRARLGNDIALASMRSVSALLVLLLVWAILYLVANGWGELTRPAFYTHSPDIGGPGSGAGPQLFNTVYVLVLSLLITVPLGVAAGIYFAEFAGQGRLANIARRATETLATLPSIVVGLFGFSLFVQATHSHPSRLAAALSLVVINLPYAVRVSEDALRALPAPLREGSLALGATRWQTVARAMLPASVPSLVTGLIILTGRGFGEAAAILFTGSAGAITSAPNYTLNPLLGGDTLAVLLYVFRTQAEPSAVPDARQFADGVAALLVLLVLAFNIGARLLGRLAIRRLQGASP